MKTKSYDNQNKYSKSDHLETTVTEAVSALVLQSRMA